MKRTGLILLPLLALGGCASIGSDRVPMNLRDADVLSKTIDNGDRIDEYRVAGQLRMVKITPERGAPYYLYDKDGDGHFDNQKDGVSPVYWKLYSW